MRGKNNWACFLMILAGIVIGGFIGSLFPSTFLNYGQSFGEHLHMEIASVNNKSLQYWNNGGIGLYNAIHMWNGLYVNDTVLLRGESYKWQTYNVPPLPPYNKSDFIVMFNNISNTKRKRVDYGRFN